MNLKEWSQIFLKQRDIIKREIESITENKEGFLILTKKKEERIIVVHEELKYVEAEVIICLNTKKNVQNLLNTWQAFAKKEDLLLVFANPKTNEKWLLKPHHHDKISDNESLKQGLLSMHDAVSSA